MSGRYQTRPGGGAPGPSRGPRGPPPEVYAPVGGSIPPPSLKVASVENNIQKTLSLSGGLGLEKLQIDTQFPKRPGYGTQGRKVVLWANYFEMIPSPDLVLYRYNVAVEPAATGRKLSQIIKLLLAFPAYAENKDSIVTDFKSTLISRKRLQLDAVDPAFQYRADGEDTPLANAQRYRLHVEETGVLTVSDLIDYLSSTDLNATCADKLPLSQALNIFLNHYAKSTPAIATVGSNRAFSLPPASPERDLRAGLFALRGFFSSVRFATCRILVNVNVSHGAFYDAIRLDQLMIKHGQENNNSISKLQSFLKFVRVQVTHLPEKKNQAGVSILKVKTIFALANTDDGQGLEYPPQVERFGAGPQGVEFFLSDSSASGLPSNPSTDQAAKKDGGKKKGKDSKGSSSGHDPGRNVAASGKYISVYDFFKTVYGRLIANPRFPVVNVGNRQHPIYLPPEVCIVLPGQHSSSKLDPFQMQQMIKFAVRSPSANAKSITQDGVKTVGLLPQVNPKLGHFDLSVNPSLITVPGRVLGQPKIKYQKEKLALVQGGSWNMQNIKFSITAPLRNWTFLFVGLSGRPDSFSKTGVESAVSRFHGQLKFMGIDANPPAPGSKIELSDTYDAAQIEAALRPPPGNSKPTRLVLIVLPKADPLLYSRIKHVADVKVGVHTVCVVGSKFINASPQYFANVALKVNLKLGGVNQLLENPKLGIINEKKTMVVGIDVTHPSPGSASIAPSVAGMVASVDHFLGQWPADLRIQEARKEMVTELDLMLKTRLVLWKTQGNHKEFPENLLVYRDGVSEGQYATVLEQELKLYRKACREIYPATDTDKGLPKITIIIVGKRHHTRFYPTAADDADRSCNTKNGTVVDRGVTEARNWDFFLQAHTALQGTARPAHYFVIHDEIFTKRKVPHPHSNAADVLEDLTHNLCYLFGRATKAVSICPPAYYADILCERARCYLSGLFDMATPSGTPATSVAGEGALSEARREDVVVHDNLKDTMFYI